MQNKDGLVIKIENKLRGGVQSDSKSVWCIHLTERLYSVQILLTSKRYTIVLVEILQFNVAITTIYV